jgi:sugar transferase (PEP-CTERM/EpsH1 system associated)
MHGRSFAPAEGIDAFPSLDAPLSRRPGRALNVLFLAHRVPYPLDKGERIRAYHEIRALAAHGHRVYLVSLCEERHPSASVEALAAHCASVQVIPVPMLARRLRTGLALLRNRPLSCGHFESPVVRRIVAGHLASGQIDVVVAYSSTMLQYIPPEWRRKTVADLVDSDAEKWLDFARRSHPLGAGIYGLEARRLRAYEDSIVNSCAATVVVSEREARVFRSAKRPYVITAGVDLNSFVAPAPIPRPNLSSSIRRIIFVGTMAYRPNVDAVCSFANLVLPLIQAAVPNTEFVIVGHSPSRAVRRLGRLPGVVVAGRVPDVRDYFWSADVCVAPLAIARGIQNKVLESMAAGCPVVSSSEAVAGLDVHPGQELLIADEPDAFAAQVLRLLADPALADAIASSARVYVNREHQLATIGGQFAALVAATCAANSTAPAADATRPLDSLDAAPCAR